MAPSEKGDVNKLFPHLFTGRMVWFPEEIGQDKSDMSGEVDPILRYSMYMIVTMIIQ